MSEKRTPSKVIFTALAVGVLAGLAVFGLARQLAAPAPAPRAPEPQSYRRHAGAPARGVEIHEATLDRELPPAPTDAVAYDMNEPLRNGRTVEQKSRWLWVPDGERISLSRAESGKLAIAVPAGTMLWKEFYLATSTGPQLIERRILKKVEADPARNGGLSNGGWRFWAAHHLPASADGVAGFDAQIADTLDSAGRARWLFKTDEWLPTRPKSAMTLVTFQEAGASIPYAFPGKTNCEYCHAGGSATVAPGAHEFQSFGIHPENMTPASFRAVVAKGWVDAPPELVAELSRERPAPADPETARLDGIFRNNCSTCHTTSPHAPGRETAFAIDPVQPRTRAELAAALADRAKFMGALGKPIVTRGKPAESELILRLKGEQGRRRMPPVEGGVPDPDVELTTLSERWITATK